MGGVETKFSSAGREDVDVRMLGTGRPFVIEVLNPRTRSITAEMLEKMRSTINSSSELVQVSPLEEIQQSHTEILKAGEDAKTKTYS